jgi:hypothetical protein
VSGLLLAIGWASKLAILAILVGLYARGRARQCRTFVAYLLIVVGFRTATALWPGTFFTPEWWMVKQALYDAAKFLVAVELAWRTLRAFPGALRTAKLAALLLLPGIAILIASLPVSGSGFHSLGEWAPRMVVGTVALFTMTAMLVLWYRLPIRPWHRALVMGFSAYLLVFTVLLNLLHTAGWAVVSWVNLADGLAYLGLSTWWTVEAWRAEPELEGIPLSVQRRLGLAEPEHA